MDGTEEQFARLREIELRPEARTVLFAGGNSIPGACDLHMQGLGYAGTG